MLACLSFLAGTDACDVVYGWQCWSVGWSKTTNISQTILFDELPLKVIIIHNPQRLNSTDFFSSTIMRLIVLCEMTDAMLIVLNIIVQLQEMTMWCSVYLGTFTLKRHNLFVLKGIYNWKYFNNIYLSSLLSSTATSIS